MFANLFEEYFCDAPHFTQEEEDNILNKLFRCRCVCLYYFIRQLFKFEIRKFEIFKKAIFSNQFFVKQTTYKVYDAIYILIEKRFNFMVMINLFQYFVDKKIGKFKDNDYFMHLV